MKNSLLTILRNKETTTAQFRETTHQLAHHLAIEASTHLSQKEHTITTPLANTSGQIPSQSVILVPVLRAGLSLLPTFLSHFTNAKVGFIGLFRDEETAEAQQYYQKLPPLLSEDLVILLEPMLATGGSTTMSVRNLISAGASESQIITVHVISAPEGKNLIKKEFPQIKSIIAAEDPTLNNQKFIVPGLGDFGDRYFGTD